MDEQLMTITQASRELGLNNMMIRYHVQRQRIPSRKFGNYCLVRIDDVVSALREYGNHETRKRLPSEVR